MAELDDVQDALVNWISAALYPNGVDQPSLLGIGFRIYAGQPTAAVLDADIRSGYSQVNGQWVLTDAAANWAHITVNVRPGVGRPTRPYVFGPPAIGTAPTQTMTVAVAGSGGSAPTITLGGTPAAGLGVAAAVNQALQGVTAGPSDTLTTLATALAAILTEAGQTCTASGAVVTCPAGTLVQANTFLIVPTWQETARQIMGFETCVYCAGRANRTAIGRFLKSTLDNFKQFTLPDGYQANMKPASPIAVDDDRVQQALLFIRKIYHQVEYPTTVMSPVATLAIAQAIFTDPAGDALATVTES